jgi:hypothetical protein
LYDAFLNHYYDKQNRASRLSSRIKSPRNVTPFQATFVANRTIATLAQLLTGKFDKFDYRDAIIAPSQNIKFTYGDTLVTINTIETRFR